MRRRWLGIGLVVLLVLPWLLDQLIVTDQERVEDLCRTLAEAAGRRDLDRAMEFLTEDFESTAPRLRASDPQGFRDRVESAWRGLEEVRLEFDQVTLQGERPEVEAEVVAWLFLRGRGMQGGGLLKAQCELRYEDDGRWRVAALRGLDLSGGF